MITRPTSITICFIGADPTRTDYQQSQLSDLAQSYNVLFWKRSDKNREYYYSWSQIVNEAISESPNEFIFFINPKIEPKSSDIEFMLDKLLNGFCWISVIGTGYSGATIELFRQIGLFDERYLGSEFEDDDLSLRLRSHGKAIHWGFDFSRYPSEDSPLSSYRGCAESFFTMKWNLQTNNFWEQENVYFMNMKLFNNQKRLSSHISNNNNQEISSSWMDYSESHFSNEHQVCFRGRFGRIIEDHRPDVIIRDKAKILIKSTEDGTVKLEFQCKTKTKIFIFIVNAEEGKEHNLTTNRTVLSSHGYDGGLGGWASLSLDLFSKVERNINYAKTLEIRIFHQGEKVYHNHCCEFPLDLELDLGLRIQQKVGELLM
jgi:hypothetical protein